jgi:hypothetical protein
MRRLHLLQGKLWPSFFWDSQSVLDFLTEQRTIINAAYYSKLLKDRVKPAFHSKRRGHQSKASVSSMTIRVRTQEVPPHPAYSPDLVPSDFHLFGPLKEVLGRKRFRADDEVELFVQRWLDEQTQTFFERGIMKLPERRRRYIAVQGAYVKKKKQAYNIRKK